MRAASFEDPTMDTVGTFAQGLGRTTETLLAQLREAGIEKLSADAPLSDQEKQQLLRHLQMLHGTATPEGKRITLVKAGPGQRKRPSPSGRVVLVGSLGAFDYGKAGERGKGLLDAYERCIRAFYVRLTADSAADRASELSFREICRRLTRTLKRLRRSVSRTPVCRQRTRMRLPRGVERHGGAFFNILKVDGRNLP